MLPLTRSDLFSLEHYAEQRPQLRREILAHKRNRHIALGEHVRLLFEDRLTIQYQIQEMLRVERIFEAAAIQAELDAYNPLIPNGDNLKATMLIEYEDERERRAALERLRGIERQIYAQVDATRIYAIADEDLERENEHKTASVHFLRFQFEASTIAALRAGARFVFGSDHPQYQSHVVMTQEQRQALLADFS